MDAQEMYEKISAKIDRLIDKLDTRMADLDKKVQGHEVRIVVLEQRQPSEARRDWKGDVIVLLVKALTVGAVALGSLAGAGGILSKMFGG